VLAKGAGLVPRQRLIFHGRLMCACRGSLRWHERPLVEAGKVPNRKARLIGAASNVGFEHKERFPGHRLNARCPFSHETFAATRDDGGDPPEAVACVTANLGARGASRRNSLAAQKKVKKGRATHQPRR
jgi:hypothetical protein